MLKHGIRIAGKSHECEIYVREGFIYLFIYSRLTSVSRKGYVEKIHACKINN
jgi:hypothetical protein